MSPDQHLRAPTTAGAAPTPAPTRVPAATLNAWSRIAREVIGTPYPWAPAHLVTGPDDTSVVPHVLHPAFHGALDWHSCVHMQWSLATLLHRHADDLDPAEQTAARTLLDGRLTADNVAAEVAYLRQRPGFERPYGWAWAAQLVATVSELATGSSTQDTPVQESPHGVVEVVRTARDEGPARWTHAMAPLGDLLAERVLAWLPRQAYPVRHGKHQNDAFALLLLLDAYRRLGRDDVVEVCRSRALDWFATDRDADTTGEPGGSDFLSPVLTQALLMTRVLPQEEVRAWLEGYLPGLGEGTHEHLLNRPTVLDPTDGQGAHLLGLALSRAWALRGLAGWREHPVAARLRESARSQEEAVQDHITDGHFMATHWLVSFALLARGGLV